MRFGRESDHARESGLTGSPDIPEPPSPDGPRDLRSRLRSLRKSISSTVVALPRVLHLVWETSHPLTVGLAGATLLAGVMPAATAYTAKLLINSVVFAIQHPGTSTPLVIALPLVTIRSPLLTATGVIVALAAIQFGIYAVNSLLSTLQNITQQHLQQRMTLQRPPLA